MKRKLMLVLLAALLAVGLVGANARAARAETVYTEGTLYYTISNESITIVGCFGRDAEVHVPAMIAGIPVNTIASGAFAENQYVKVVYLPDTISKVGRGAFGSWVRVVYNANTDHPQDTPTDLILGLLTPATDDPNATEPPEPPTEPTTPPETPDEPTEPTTPPATPAEPTATPKPTATPAQGSGTEEFGATPKPTKKPSSNPKATDTPAPTATPEPTPEIDVGPIGEVTDDGTVVAEVEVSFGEEELKETPEPTAEPTPEPTEEPTPEPTAEPTDAPKATEAPTEAPKATEAPTAEPAPEPEQPKGKGWIWAVAGLAVVGCAGGLVAARKKKQ